MIKTNPIETAPYNKPVYFIFPGNLIQTGVREKKTWYRYLGTSAEQKGDYDEYRPYGVGATYGRETYFLSDPVGWLEIGSMFSIDPSLASSVD